jgi:hypothetical protein
MSFDDIAMAVCFLAATLLVLWIVATVILSRACLAGRRDGLREGQLIGELAELRRRDEMNVRARERTHEQTARDDAEWWEKMEAGID